MMVAQVKSQLKIIIH